MSAAEIIERMRELPAEQKRKVVEQIWAEFGNELGWVDPDLTPEQAAELDRRLDNFEKNPHEGVSWEQLQADLRNRFGWK
jgi:putative addiction module component (TIGR02574 family)